MFCLMHVLTCLIHCQEQRKSSFCFPLYSSTQCLLNSFCNHLKWCDVRNEAAEELWLFCKYHWAFLPLLLSLEELHQPECCALLWNLELYFSTSPSVQGEHTEDEMGWHKCIFHHHQGVKMCTGASYSSFCSTCSVHLYVSQCMRCIFFCLEKQNKYLWWHCDFILIVFFTMCFTNSVVSVAMVLVTFVLT